MHHQQSNSLLCLIRVTLSSVTALHRHQCILINTVQAEIIAVNKVMYVLDGYKFKTTHLYPQGCLGLLGLSPVDY